MLSHALHPSIFEQPEYIDFFNALLEPCILMSGFWFVCPFCVLAGERGTVGGSIARTARAALTTSSPGALGYKILKNALSTCTMLLA
jgi:hypothetical protein